MTCVFAEVKDYICNSRYICMYMCKKSNLASSFIFINYEYYFKFQLSYHPLFWQYSIIAIISPPLHLCIYVFVFIALQALEEEVSAHYNQFDTVVTNGGQVDKERVDRLKELWIDLEQQVAEKKMFVTAGLELQQVCVSVSVLVSVCGSVCLHVFVSVCVHVCVYMCGYMHACMHAHMQI